MKENDAPCPFDASPNLIASANDLIRPEMLTLVELNQQQIDNIVKTVPGGANNVQDIYPLTPSQEGMLFHHRLHEQADTYVLSMPLKVQCLVQLEALINALQNVINRHPILRSAILWEHLPRPIQVVYRSAQLPVKDLLLDRNRDDIEQLKEWMTPERQKWELRQAPLVRLQVAPNASGTCWYVLLQLHHLVCDHRSLKVVVAEATAYLGGRSQSLPEPVPFRAHVAQALADIAMCDGEAFFRSRLGAIDEPTAPFGLLNVHGDGTRIVEDRRFLDPALAQRVRTQARHLQVTAARLFHAAWALVVSRTSGRHEVIFGTALLARRHRSELAQPTVGLFVNTLPLRLELDGITARELVEEAQRELEELLNHVETSLAVAQSCSSVPGSVPLFSTLLNYRHSVPNSQNEWSMGAGIRALTPYQFRTNYPVTLTVDNLGEQFALTVQTIQCINPSRVTEYLQTALESLVEALERAPQTPALNLSILPESERHQIVDLFNATQAPYPHDKLIHELFQEQANRIPEAIALLYEEQALTYAELNSRANQLARHLKDKGVGPEQLVGICVERGLEMVIGLLGILKAGGAYVPLDPNYPPETLRYMLEDAVPKVVLTQESVRNRLLPTAAELVTLDSDWNDISRWGGGNLDALPSQWSSQRLAYVIYTSGSTGRPKGVMVAHAGVVNVLTSMHQSLGVNETDFLLAVTTVSFDISAVEIYLPLLNGAKVVLASREAASDARRLIAMLEQFDITLMQATPTTWQLLLSGGWSGRSDFRALCGGEALTTDLSKKLLSRVKTLWNLYGPTETTIWSCGRQISVVSDESGSVEAIGRPIANTRIYVLDGHQQAVPIGVVGEIYIGGAGVARGYLNRPELTTERFLADPFSAELGARMYRSGDLARWRADGMIECLGRNDHQVKIRGFRVELGEIEAQLARHEHVKEALVIAREDVPGDKRLVAYVLPSDPAGAEAVPNVEALRTHLQAGLPDYMVPSAFVILERMPLTPNGKLDRRALPAPELGAYVSRHYEAPQGEVEKILATIWEELLVRNQVGIHDNFFDLGGHSLLATRVLSLIRDRLQVELSVRALFDAPTVKQLSVRVGVERAEQEALRTSALARDFRRAIDGMHDDEVLARIAELEAKLNAAKGGESARGWGTKH